MGQKTLSKSDFIKRGSLRAKRYNATFDQGQLEEWIKQGLTFAGERGPNIERRPTYTYGCRHYRRALQLIRFHSAGIKDRDEILVQLFIRNYGVKPHEIRESLRVEYRKSRDKLNAPVRSIYADQEVAIPSVRKTQFKRQLGSLDARLKTAGFIIPDDLLFSFVRAARSSEDREFSGPPINSVPAEVQEVLNAFGSLLGGMLSKDEEYESKVERTIRLSSESDYELAKTTFQQIHSMFSAGIDSENNNPDEQNAYRAIYDSMLRREFAAFLLVQCLILTARQPNSQK